MRPSPASAPRMPPTSAARLGCGRGVVLAEGDDELAARRAGGLVLALVGWVMGCDGRTYFAVDDGTAVDCVPVLKWGF